MRIREIFETILQRIFAALTPRDRRALGIGRFGGGRRVFRAVLAEGIRQWCAANPDPDRPDFDDDGESETPFLDFLRYLIDSGKIQAFLKWFFEALPVLIKAIVSIFMVV